jgi:hypothetical protein
MPRSQQGSVEWGVHVFIDITDDIQVVETQTTLLDLGPMLFDFPEVVD